VNEEEEDQAGQLWDAVPDEGDEDVVLVVDAATLGKGKGKGKARGSRSVSTTSKASSSSSRVVVASNPPPEDVPTNSRSPSPFRSPSPTPTDAHSTSPPDLSIPANNHFSNFAYAGARSLSSSTSNGGIKPRSNSTAPTVKIVVPECTVRDIQMRKIKKCLFCQEDWSTGRKAVKVKWVRLSSFFSLATLFVSLLFALTNIPFSSTHRLTSTPALSSKPLHSPSLFSPTKSPPISPLPSPKPSSNPSR